MRNIRSLFHLFHQIAQDIKWYLSIHYRNRMRYPDSTVLSFLPKQIIVGSRLNIRSNILLSNKLKSIGNNTYIGNGTKVFNCSEIGSYCSISHDVKIGLPSHSKSSLSTNYRVPKNTLGEVDSIIALNCVIGHDVLISANAMILAGVSLGNGCIVGAGAFVNINVPAYSIVAGVPARIIGYRFEESVREKLNESEWWNLKLEELIEISRKSDLVEYFSTKSNL